MARRRSLACLRLHLVERLGSLTCHRQASPGVHPEGRRGRASRQKALVGTTGLFPWRGLDR